MATAGRRGTVSIDDVITAIETARDKVMVDEVKQMVKLGLPKSHANKLVAAATATAEGDEGESQDTAPRGLACPGTGSISPRPLDAAPLATPWSNPVFG